MRKMTRAEKQMSDAEAMDILRQGEYGVLSTVDAEGQPYGIPVNYVLIDQAIYFHCALKGHKVDNIKSNSRVCFTVVGSYQVVPSAFSTNYQSVVAFGTASVVADAEKVGAMRELLKKYTPDFLDKGEPIIEKAKEKLLVIKIDITHLSAKKNQK